MGTGTTITVFPIVSIMLFGVLSIGRSVLEGKIASRLKKLLSSKTKEWSYEIIELEVMPDHVHLLVQVAPDTGINNLVAKLKGYTASVLKKEFPELTTRLPALWTRSRFIASVGSANLETVKSYIENQKHV